jgi:hypothetical protein
MKKFMDSDFLLKTETAKVLFENYASKLPIIDYHCHIPPKEIADVCVFVPHSPFRDNEGFFVIFQSAATGECIKPKKI